MQLYTITNSWNRATTLTIRIESLRRLAAGWANGGVEYIQIREKDLTAGELERLAFAVVHEIEGSRTRVLINGRVDVALAAGADGVHLPGGQQFCPSDVRWLFASRGEPDPPVSISCHSLEEVKAAKTAGATLVLFAPVFEKLTPGGRIPGTGLDILSRACLAASPLPVFALGGINKENAKQCTAVGAAGVAAIRLFAGEEWHQLARRYH
jgi:thiamine-phosphate pyrophosphorylase